MSVHWTIIYALKVNVNLSENDSHCYQKYLCGHYVQSPAGIDNSDNSLFTAVLHVAFLFR